MAEKEESFRSCREDASFKDSFHSCVEEEQKEMDRLLEQSKRLMKEMEDIEKLRSRNWDELDQLKKSVKGLEQAGKKNIEVKQLKKDKQIVSESCRSGETEDLSVKISIAWNEGDFFSDFDNIKTILWPKDMPMNELENALRTRLSLKNPKEKMLIYIKDTSLPSGWAHFYSRHSPKELRLSRSSTIFCIGLSPGQTVSRGERLSLEAHVEEGRARFGEDFQAAWDQQQVLVTWSPEEVKPPMDIWKHRMLVTLEASETPEKLETYLRYRFKAKQPGHWIFMEIMNNGKILPFYGFLSFEELNYSKDSSIRMTSKHLESDDWQQCREVGEEKHGAKFKDYLQSSVMSQNEGLLERLLQEELKAFRSQRMLLERDSETTRLVGEDIFGVRIFEPMWSLRY